MRIRLSHLSPLLDKIDKLALFQRNIRLAEAPTTNKDTVETYWLHIYLVTAQQLRVDGHDDGTQRHQQRPDGWR